MGTLLIRADASVTIGTGHVMRCLALAQAWQDAGGKAVLAMAEWTPAVQERLHTEGVELERLELGDLKTDVSQLVQLATKHRASWVVVDGYRFDEAYLRALKNVGHRVLLLDDLAREMHYSADRILNQNVHACEAAYQQREAGTRMLLGPRYALLRREFNQWREWRREIAETGRRVLVAMGGSDPDNATLKLIQTLAKLERDVEVRVIAGGSNPYIELLEEAVEKAAVAMELHRNVLDMPSALAWADLAITSAGTICWELCLMGLPSLIIDLAENQRPVAVGLHRLGAALHIGGQEEIVTAETLRCIQNLLDDRATRARLSENARRLVDGRGTGRVLLALRSHDIDLRRVRPEDKELLWRWANDLEVRSASFCSAPIPWEEHSRWFDEKLRNGNTKLFIAVIGDAEPIGQVRLERLWQGEAEIHLSLAKECRSKGYAASLIERGTEEAFSETDVTRLHAFVKPQNIASSRAFERADFKQLQVEQVRGGPALHYVREREEQGSQEMIPSAHASSFHE